MEVGLCCANLSWQRQRQAQLASALFELAGIVTCRKRRRRSTFDGSCANLLARLTDYGRWDAPASLGAYERLHAGRRLVASSGSAVLLQPVVIILRLLIIMIVRGSSSSSTNSSSSNDMRATAPLPVSLCAYY